MEDQKKRPKLITILGFINIFDCLASIFLIVLIYFLSEKSSSDTSLIGLILFFSFSALSVSVGVGLLKGLKWSWYAQFLIIGLVVYQTIGDFVSYSSDVSEMHYEIGRLGPFEGVFLLIICFLIVVYLNSKKVKLYFKIKT